MISLAIGNQHQVLPTATGSVETENYSDDVEPTLTTYRLQIYRLITARFDIWFTLNTRTLLSKI